MGTNLSKQDAAEDCMKLGRRRSDLIGEPKQSFRSAKTSSGAAATRLRTSCGLPIAKGHSDDVLSKGTESTQNSPEMGEAYPVIAVRLRTEIRQDEALSQTQNIGSSRGGIWFHRQRSGRSGPSENNDNDALPSALETKCAQHKMDAKLPKPSNRRQVSAPLPVKHQKQFSRKIPQHKSQPHDPSSHAFVEQEDSDHLSAMYDMRTWDMYIRITEARKQRATSCPGVITSNPRDAAEREVNDDPSHQEATDSNYLPLPPSQIDYGYFSRADDMDSPGAVPSEIGSTGHEMFFGDLE